MYKIKKSRDASLPYAANNYANYAAFTNINKPRPQTDVCVWSAPRQPVRLNRGMDSKKERSSRQRLKVDIGRGAKDDDGTLLLANPMAGGEVSSPRTPTSSHSDHVPSKAAPWKKGGPKSPSILRFFVRGSTSSRKASEDVEDSLSCDHDDGLSVSLRAYIRSVLTL